MVDKTVDQDTAVFDMFTYLTENATSQEISGNMMHFKMKRLNMNLWGLDAFSTIWTVFLFLFFFSELPTECGGWFDKGHTNSGIYAVKPNQSEAFNVYCDMSAGWSN